MALTTFNVDLAYCRRDAQKLEEWARTQDANSLVAFSSRDGEIENMLKSISQRAQGKGNFSYSRFFAVGLFRLLELANATEPSILEKVLCPCNYLFILLHFDQSCQLHLKFPWFIWCA